MKRSTLLLLMGPALVGTAGLRAGAQVAPAATQPALKLNVESFYARDPAEGVSVPDSATALEKLAHATRMQRLGQWDTAASLLQEILEKYPDKVVPARANAEGAIEQYTSVATAVQEQLAHWPKEGLRVYRNLYEAPAAAILDKAPPNDRNALNKVCTLYFATDAGKTAALRLIDLDLESGEFPAAAWMGERLLKWHPDLLVERPRVLYRTAYAYHMAGNEALAQAPLRELQQHFADAVGTIRGKDVNLAATLAEALKRPVAMASAGSAGNAYPMFGGGPDRAVIPATTCNPGAKLFTVPFVSASEGLSPGEARTLEQQEQFATTNGLNVGVIPVVDRGQLFFQDGKRVYAVSLDSGVPLAGWATTYPGERHGQYALSSRPSPRRSQYTLTLSDEAVYAVMGGQDQAAAMRGEGPDDTRLVCLDRSSGREKWSVAPGQLPDKENLRSLRFGGSPVVVGDNLYLLARGGKNGTFEECHAICLDAHTGQFRWSSYIAGANTGVANFGGEAVRGPESITHLAYASGRLYAVTNTGALAALDAYSGSIQWLTIYPRNPQPDPNQAMNLNFRARRTMALAQTKPWSYDPVVVKEGHVFSLPTDSPYLLVHDAGTGAELRRIDRKEIGNSDCLLGVWGDWILCGAEDRAWAVNWRTYDSQKENNEASIPRSLPLAAVRGRGFVTSDSVYMPTVEHLERLALSPDLAETGLIDVDRYPPYNQTWDKGEGPGNVVVAEDHVVIATSDGVNVYTDLKVAEAKLDEAIARSPGDPDPRLRYAELLFVAGQREVALAKLDEAIGLLGGMGAMRIGPQRDHVFNTALTFAQKLGRESGAPAELAGQLFQRAAAAASSPSQQVSYRVTRAADADAKKDYATEAQLLQEILAEPELRDIPITRSDAEGPRPARIVAEQAIAELLKKEGGAAAYAPFEQAAAEQLKAAQSQNNPAKLSAVADAYPNSASAPKALLAAADLYEAAGNPRLAKETLRQIVFRYHDLPEPQRLFESLARNYLKLHDRANAVARLQQAAALAPAARLSKPLALPDGKTVQEVTYHDAAEMLNRLAETTDAPALPDFNIAPARGDDPPLVEPAGSSIAGIDALVKPERGFARFDRLVTFSANAGLAIYPVGQAAPPGTSKTIAQAPLGCAWRGDNVLVWSADGLSLLAGDSAATLWSCSLKSLPALEVVRSGGMEEPQTPANRPEMAGNAPNFMQVRLQAAGFAMPPAPEAPEATAGGEQVTAVRPVGDRVVLATSSGRILCLNAADGSVAWQTRLAERPVERLLANEDFVVVRLIDETGQQIVALNTFSGQIVHRLGFGAGALGPVNLALSPAGVLVYTLPDRLCAKDLYEPGETLKFSTTPQANTAIATYSGFVRPDQLVISEGRILAVSDQGQFVRVHSLETGRLVYYRDNDSGKEVPARLQTECKNDYSVSLRAIGSRFYVFGAAKVKYYNLDNPADQWTGEDSSTTLNFREAMVGQDHIVLVDQPMAWDKVLANARPAPPAPAGLKGAAPPARGQASTLRLFAFSRARVSGGRESGLLDGVLSLNNTSGPAAVQPVAGGFYFLGSDHVLHYLHGAATRP
jgi:outer membrane protein assembly factor BamB/tetratricopeptide (TPR) repeat protein